MPDDERAGVPKFTSFRPKPPSDKDASAKSNLDKSGEDRRSREQRSDHSPRRKEWRSKSREARERSLATNAQQLPQSSKYLAPETPGGEFFVSDRRGDSDNLRYGSIHRYAIPQYRRAGKGSIIGLNPTMKIDRSRTNEKSVIINDAFLNTKGSKDILAGAYVHKEIRVRPENTESLEDLTKDFLILDDHATGEADSDDDHYRSINGNAKESKAVESADNDHENESHLGIDVISRLMAAGSALSQRLEKESSSAQLWFDLIDNQNQLQTHRQAGRKPTLSEKQSYADIKLSLLEKALKNVKEAIPREKLVGGYLEEAQRVWDVARLRKKWEEVIADHSGSKMLWHQYLNFIQTDSTRFKLDDIKALYSKFFMVLHQSGNITDPRYSAYALLRLTLCLEAAGFSEQAIAIWQANLEWTFRSPNCDREDSFASREHDKAKESLEEFWDAEVPRIGEAGSIGWAAHCLNHGEELQLQGNLANTQSSRPALGDWGYTERRDMVQAYMPARTTDELDEDDAYRVVLFSDVEPYLLKFVEPSSHFMINSFLLFCQLPPLSNGADGVSSFNQDGLVRDQKLSNRGLEAQVHTYSKLPNPTVTDQIDVMDLDPLHFDTPNCGICLDTLYASPRSWLSAFPFKNSKDKLAPDQLQWTQRVLEALLDTLAAGIEFLEYYVAFELWHLTDRARKTIKSRLRKQQSNLRLYNIYALVEFRLGSIAKAQDALQKAIRMSKSHPDTVLLRRTLVWETLEDSGPDTALAQLLGTSAQTPSTSNTADLDAHAIHSLQRELIASRERALPTKSYSHALASIDLLILLSYLTNPSSPLPAALAIFNSNISLLSAHLPTTSTTHELLHQSLARLLHYHATHSTSFQPSVLRSALTQSIALFPTNTVFLFLYAWNESRFRINDRVRSIVRDILDNPANAALNTDTNSGSTPTNPSPTHSSSTSSLIPHLFAIQTELSRPSALGSNAHTVRSAFERALSPLSTSISTSSGIFLRDNTPHAPLLWRKYFHFELELGRGNGNSGSSNSGSSSGGGSGGSGGSAKRAKDVFYRAVAACPWVKEFYLWPFLHLRDVMSGEELRGVYEMVGERELRVRVRVEDG